MSRLSPTGRTLREEADLREEDLFDTSSDEEEAKAKRNEVEVPPKEHSSISRAEAERRALNLVTNGGWGRGTSGGASGLLRKGNSPTTVTAPAERTDPRRDDDDGVD